MSHAFQPILDRFSEQSVVVFGDLIADVYLVGTTSRISREAPVLIVRQESQEIRLGGAANVVANLQALGARPIPVGVVGQDPDGDQLLRLLKSKGVSTEFILQDPQVFTTTKTRILAGGSNTVRQQMIRIDKIREEPVRSEVRDNLLERLRFLLVPDRGVIYSDYGEGTLADSMLGPAVELALQAGCRVYADSRHQIAAFRGLTALVPNEPELAEASGLPLETRDALEAAGRWLLRETGCQCALVKRGRNGMALFQPTQETVTVPAYGSVEVADVTGAGDTVMSAFSLAHLSGATPVEAMRIANVAGGIKVTKSGTAVVEVKELYQALGEAP